MLRIPRPTFALAVAMLLSGFVSACSRQSPLEPQIASAPDPATQAAEPEVPPPPSRLTATESGLLGKVLSLPWYILTEKTVLKGRLEVVEASRYQLTFQSGSLSSDITCSIREYDKDVLDIELGPHGTQFKDPVTWSIDFRGTAADPGAVSHDGCEPVVWWWNDVSLRWEEVPGTTDWGTLRHVVRLKHFSRYVVGGKAGWKHQPRTESE